MPAVAVMSLALGQATPPAGKVGPPARDLRQVMLAAEDRRAASEDARAPLVEGLSSASAALRQQAVRALGRLEDASLIDRIVPLLADTTPSVRAEAANALAQAVVRQAGQATTARDALAGRLRVERDPLVVGSIAGSLGRLPVTTEADVRVIEQLLVSATRTFGTGVTVDPSYKVAGVDITWSDRRLRDAPMAALTGAVRGLESLIRLRRKIAAPTDATVSRLRELASFSSRTRSGPTAGSPAPAGGEADARVRRLAMLALSAAGAADLSSLVRAFTDQDWQVRRLAVLAAVNAPGGPVAPIVDRAITDPSPHVRTDAVRGLARRASPDRCEILATMAHDADVHVSLAAIDALASCTGSSPAPPAVAPAAGQSATDNRTDVAIATLADIAAGVPPERDPTAAPTGAPEAARSSGVPPSASADGWHGPAHALVALARLAPGAARPYLSRFANHGVWQVRTYAARAAAILAAADAGGGSAGTPAGVAAAPAAGGVADPTAVLERLAADQRANVREAAIAGLSRVRGHAADRIYVDALAATDYELIMTAARALRGSPDRGWVVPALVTALGRVTAEARDTSRDPRGALLERLEELGSADSAQDLRPYLSDFDPVIAGRAARVLTAWTGQPHQARADNPRSTVAPSGAEAAALRGALATVTMRGGRSFTVRLFPDEAPATVLRFVRLARAGYYDHLTFHRVVPNFVIQGGSPGANEYVGDGAFMRDELGLREHTRGTVGISTRGRDTGDAQFFVNLVDNPRLGHDYTVFAEVISGIETVDQIAEGAQIAHIGIVSARAARR